MPRAPSGEWGRRARPRTSARPKPGGRHSRLLVPQRRTPSPGRTPSRRGAQAAPRHDGTRPKRGVGGVVPAPERQSTPQPDSTRPKPVTAVSASGAHSVPRGAQSTPPQGDTRPDSATRAPSWRPRAQRDSTRPKPGDLLLGIRGALRLAGAHKARPDSATRAPHRRPRAPAGQHAPHAGNTRPIPATRAPRRRPRYRVLPRPEPEFGVSAWRRASPACGRSRCSDRRGCVRP
ncbi:hypothetical protein FBY39_1072 [Microbacterium sp. SLBN-146]|nr:hypothetical protein FBY39_1072 [Microbacterium sp. SLBN-146]